MPNPDDAAHPPPRGDPSYPEDRPPAPRPEPSSLPLDPWPCAFDGDRPEGDFRCRAEDFRVEEILGFSPEGEGPHCLLRVRKEEVTTHRVAQDLAARAGCRVQDVGFAGLKDRKAVATQHFTVPAGAGDPASWSGPSWAVVDARHCRRKLRRGVHAENAFELRLWVDDSDRDRAGARFERTLREGVPNYFGPQRFGRDGGNLAAARDWLIEGHKPHPRQRGLALSAARSYLFNRVLAARVELGSWDRLLPGELALLSGTRSGFVVPDPEAERNRLECGDIQPSGPMPGTGGLTPSGEATALEEALLSEDRALIEALQAQDVQGQRRALRVLPREGQWQWEDRAIRIGFRLPAGSFATSVVREVIQPGRRETGSG